MPDVKILFTMIARAVFQVLGIDDRVISSDAHSMTLAFVTEPTLE